MSYNWDVMEKNEDCPRIQSAKYSKKKSFTSILVFVKVLVQLACKSETLGRIV